MGEVVYWLLAGTVVLLSGQFTWVMSLVWLVPAFIVWFWYWQGANRSTNVGGLYFCGIGLILLGIPDCYTFTLLVPYFCTAVGLKYVGGLLLLLMSFLLFLSTQDTAGRAAGSPRRE